MRFCENDVPEVYEATGPSLADLLRDAATELETRENGYANITNGLTEEGEYYLTLYLH